MPELPAILWRIGNIHHLLDSTMEQLTHHLQDLKLVLGAYTLLGNKDYDAQDRVEERKMGLNLVVFTVDKSTTFLQCNASTNNPFRHNATFKSIIWSRQTLLRQRQQPCEGVRDKKWGHVGHWSVCVHSYWIKSITNYLNNARVEVPGSLLEFKNLERHWRLRYDLFNAPVKYL